MKKLMQVPMTTSTETKTLPDKIRTRKVSLLYKACSCAILGLRTDLFPATASPVSTKTNNTNEAKKKYYTLKNYREGPYTESGEVDSSQNQSVIKKHNKDVETRRQTY
jgi:hypothetical protein